MHDPVQPCMQEPVQPWLQLPEQASLQSARAGVAVATNPNPIAARTGSVLAVLLRNFRRPADLMVFMPTPPDPEMIT